MANPHGGNGDDCPGDGFHVAGRPDMDVLYFPDRNDVPTRGTDWDPTRGSFISSGGSFFFGAEGPDSASGSKVILYVVVFATTGTIPKGIMPPFIRIACIARRGGTRGPRPS